jgi:hypothetical protein
MSDTTFVTVACPLCGGDIICSLSALTLEAVRGENEDAVQVIAKTTLDTSGIETHFLVAHGSQPVVLQ